MAGSRAWRLLALVAISLTRVTALQGQSSPTAFDSLTLAINAVANVNRNDFHDYWDPRVGLEIQATSPFYLGTAELGVHYAGFDAKRPEQPDFTSLLIYLGWGYEWPLVSWLGWRNGVRAGSLIMVFDLPKSHIYEQELGVALSSQLRCRLAGRWTLELAARYRIVFTRKRLKHAFLAAGIGHSFGTPQWLRDLLD